MYQTGCMSATTPPHPARRVKQLPLPTSPPPSADRDSPRAPRPSVLLRPQAERAGPCARVSARHEGSVGVFGKPCGSFAEH